MPPAPGARSCASRQPTAGSAWIEGILDGAVLAADRALQAASSGRRAAWNPGGRGDALGASARFDSLADGAYTRRAVDPGDTGDAVVLDLAGTPLPLTLADLTS